MTGTCVPKCFVTDLAVDTATLLVKSEGSDAIWSLDFIIRDMTSCIASARHKARRAPSSLLPPSLAAWV